jgi:hypothetical protein
MSKIRVPDTKTFHLKDVCDVVGPANNCLDNSFLHSIDSYFDPLYKGDKSNLYNFRNYGPPEVVGDPLIEIFGDEEEDITNRYAIPFKNVSNNPTGILKSYLWVNNSIPNPDYWPPEPSPWHSTLIISDSSHTNVLKKHVNDTIQTLYPAPPIGSPIYFPQDGSIYSLITTSSNPVLARKYIPPANGEFLSCYYLDFNVPSGYYSNFGNGYKLLISNKECLIVPHNMPIEFDDNINKYRTRFILINSESTSFTSFSIVTDWDSNYIRPTSFLPYSPILTKNYNIPILYNWPSLYDRILKINIDVLNWTVNLSFKEDDVPNYTLGIGQINSASPVLDQRPAGAVQSLDGRIFYPPARTVYNYDTGIGYNLSTSGRTRRHILIDNLDGTYDIIQDDKFIETYTIGDVTYAHQWAGGQLAPNGKIYFFPTQNPGDDTDQLFVCEVNPFNNTVAFHSIGITGSLYGIPVFWGGILNYDNNIYMAKNRLGIQLPPSNSFMGPVRIGNVGTMDVNSIFESASNSNFAASAYNKFFNKVL